MRKDTKYLSILIIEDNLGDFVLIEDYLLEKFDFVKIHHCKSYFSVLEYIKTENRFDLVLLDMILPDMNGEELILNVQLNILETPIIILTGYSSIEMARKLIAKGASDFLIKDEVNPEILYKSIVYALDRQNYLENLKNTKKEYEELFNLSPQPMWIFDTTSFHFLDVNQSAISKYGYSKQEFLERTIKDILPKDQILHVDEHLKFHEIVSDNNFSGVFVHSTKAGKNITVEIYSSEIEFNKKKARLILVNDITEKERYTHTIEKQNSKLRNIAWIQSHVVRAPLARLIGIINLVELDAIDQEEMPVLLEQIKISGQELDLIIRKIVEETETFNLDSENADDSQHA